jgi:hypothetical protein
MQFLLVCLAADGLFALTSSFIFVILLTSCFFGVGDIKPSSMITSKIRMEEVDEKGFRALIEERDKHVKILVDISA